ncbi:MAG: hypothetical protein KatS3mg105_2305 [Gemmatales bacterium]|nr:MAG: hypothetical protein KatS3mg105_2305 [Gemmatales bacterium]
MVATFRPLPFLGNNHVQTILAHLLPIPPHPKPTTVRPLRLPDNDYLVLHDSVPERWHAGDAIVVMIHGLTGCHGSGNVLRLAHWLLPRGVRVVRVDLRGAGAGEKLSRRLYNAGCSDDVREAVAEVHRWSPSSPITLVGFSLGGNIVLKLAGEAGSAPPPGLIRVAAFAPPVDMKRCAALLERGVNRLYDAYFTRRLVRMVYKQQECFPELPRITFPRRIRLRLFDELYTAPRGGFTDANDYYEKSSALRLLSRIQLPTLILTAQDDPFISADPLLDLPANPSLDIRIIAKGGHLGFIGPDGAGGIHWGERALADWIAPVS